MKSKFVSGWVPDLPDHRDYLYAAPMQVLKKLPDKIDLRSKCPKVYDQGQIGSCTANAIGATFEFNLRKQRKKDFMPSRLFIYYNERVMEHTVNSDSGAQIRDGIKSIGKQGVCPEKSWPYDIEKLIDKPAAKCYTEAKKHTAISYQRLTQTLTQMKGCLASGYPFVFGFTVYENFESEKTAETGTVDMPKPKEKVLGGHAVMAVGYDDKQHRFIIRNSWGTSWGLKGYFTMPYEYLLDDNLADDFWTVRLVK
jgi:C1A family cysteine protease